MPDHQLMAALPRGACILPGIVNPRSSACVNAINTLSTLLLSNNDIYLQVVKSGRIELLLLRV
jgi:hypothetical protein